MRLSLVISLVAITSLAPAVALACGAEEGVQRQVDPTLFVQEQSNELMMRAQRLENVAHSVAEQARHADRRAAEFTAQAREFKQVAFGTDGVERSNLLIAAGELSLRASQEKQRAQRSRLQARNLRTQAQALRDRANRLTGVGIQPVQHRRRMRPVI
jgi:hypothetical protein